MNKKEKYKFSRIFISASYFAFREVISPWKNKTNIAKLTLWRNECFPVFLYGIKLTTAAAEV